MNFTFDNRVQLFEVLPDERFAHLYLPKVKWKHRVVCPYCGSIQKIHAFSDGSRHNCVDCDYAKTIAIINVHGGMNEKHFRRLACELPNCFIFCSDMGNWWECCTQIVVNVGYGRLSSKELAT